MLCPSFPILPFLLDAGLPLAYLPFPTAILLAALLGGPKYVSYFRQKRCGFHTE